MSESIQNRISYLNEIIPKVNLVNSSINKDTIYNTYIPLIEKHLSDVLEEKNKYHSTNEFNFIDLFSGAGGLSLGFEQTGIYPTKALDNNQHANLTYWFNRPYMKKVDLISQGIETVDLSSLNKTPLIIGGPPCQGFSNANKQKIKNDSRNKLYKFFVKSLNKLQPSLFLMENVPGILKFKNIINEDFNNAGYTVKPFAFNTSDFGFPQNRKRVFFIGINKKCKKIHTELFSIMSELFIHKINRDFNLSDAISDLPELRAKTVKNKTNFESNDWGYTISKVYNFSSKYCLLINNNKNLTFPLLNHKSKYNNERDINIYRLLKQGEKSDAKSIKDINPYKRRNNIFKDKFFKLKDHLPCKTITSHMYYDCHMYIHPNQARGLTPREAARVQGFPDSYLFLGSPNEWYRQIGNSVSPILAKLIAQKTLKILKRIYSV